MVRRINSRDEAIAYISGRLIECLECGKKLTLLAKHLRVSHYMTSDEYREKYNIPVSIPLAGAEYREKQRLKMLRLHAEGRIDYSHLPDAVEAARNAGRGVKRDFDKNRQSEIMKTVNDSGRAYRKGSRK